MGEQAIRTIEANGSTGNAGTGHPFMHGVNREISWPAVVGRPGQVAALKQQITGAIIADNEDDVALYPLVSSVSFPR